MGKAVCCRQCIKEQVRNKASQERSSTNGKVRPNGKQSRRSITHANSWSACLMWRLNDFLVMSPSSWNALTNRSQRKRKTKKSHLVAAVFLHLIVTRRFFKLFLNQFFPNGKIHLITSLSSSFLSSTRLILTLPLARLPKFIFLYVK